MSQGTLNIPTNAFEGEEVPININANGLYHLREDSLSYTPRDGTPVLISWTANHGAFNMPDADVRIDAVFDSDIPEILVPANGINFPIGTTDSSYSTLAYNFFLGETEVTYEFWYQVRKWADGKGYKFSNPGTIRRKNGNSIREINYDKNDPAKRPEALGELRLKPIAKINWYDALVWCNAMTEWYNTLNGAQLEQVYLSGGVPFKDATNIVSPITTRVGAKGYRMPTSVEWEIAARWQGTSKDFNEAIGRNSGGTMYYFTPGNYASAAKVPAANNAETRRVAWFNEAYTATGFDVAMESKLKAPNKLRIYDMSGNVQEWCFETDGSNRRSRGGSYEDPGENMALGRNAGFGPLRAEHFLGFRTARTE
jgi:formylglycine-generating enzyme required for sulfatase activity